MTLLEMASHTGGQFEARALAGVRVRVLIVVADYLGDDEAQKFLGEIGVELGLGRQSPQPCDLAVLPFGVGRR